MRKTLEEALCDPTADALMGILERGEQELVRRLVELRDAYGGSIECAYSGHGSYSHERAEYDELDGKIKWLVYMSGPVPGLIEYVSRPVGDDGENVWGRVQRLTLTPQGREVCELGKLPEDRRAALRAHAARTLAAALGLS